MPDLIDKTELTEAVPGLTGPWADLFVAALNSQISRVAPCLVADAADPGVVAEAKLIVFQAVQHVTETPRWVKSETTGPFSVTYVTGGRGILDGADLAALVGLCSGPVAPAVGPLGSFPDPDDYSRLFARPGRSWRG